MFSESDVLDGVAGEIDAVIANPPYLADRQRRLYRDGGGDLGIDLSLRIVREALARLAPSGQLVLYTGSPVVGGLHPLREALGPILATRVCRARWRESTAATSAASPLNVPAPVRVPVIVSGDPPNAASLATSMFCSRDRSDIDIALARLAFTVP